MSARRRLIEATYIAVIVFVLALARFAIKLSPLDQVWAEDGKIFLTDAYSHGWRAFIHTYAGYAHFVPRAIAAIAAAFPIEHAATIMAGGAAFVTALCAASVVLFAQSLGVSMLWRVVIGLSFALLPMLSAENLVNAAGLQWYLIPAAFWACLAPSKGRLRGLIVAVCLLASMSSPLVVFVLPVLLTHGRRLVRHVGAWACAAGLAIQAITIAFGPVSATNPTTRDPHLNADVFSWLEAKLAAGMLLSLSPVRTENLHSQLALAAAAMAVVVTLAVAVLLRRASVWPALTAIASGVLLFAFTSQVTTDPAPRYAGAAGLLLISAVGLAKPRWPRVVEVGVVLGLLIGAASAFPVGQWRSSGPSWAAGVETAQAQCASGAKAVYIPVSPAGWGYAGYICR